MRLFIINTGYGLSKEDISVRVRRMKKVVSPDTEITMECLENTQICIDSQLDVALAAPEIIKKAIMAEKRGFDAIGIYCTSDPGLAACREAVRIPVVGAGMASFAVAGMLGYNISFITTSASRQNEKKEFARQCGIDITRLASVRSVEYDILNGQSDSDKGQLKKMLADTVTKCRIEDNADAVILGCLSFAGMGPEISEMTSVPAVDPAYALAAEMESLVRQRLSHSLHAFPHPPERVRKWGRGVIEI